METDAGDGGAAAGEYAGGGSGDDDGYGAAQDAYTDPSAGDDAYYQYEDDSADAYTAYYGGGGAEYYADGAEAGGYAQDYDAQAYDYDAQAYTAGDGGDSPTATALPEALWYQDDQALDAAGGLADEISELQLDHRMGEYGGPASPTSWDQDFVAESAPQSNDTDVGTRGDDPETVEAGSALGDQTKTLDDNQQQPDTKKAGAAVSPKTRKARQQRIQKRQERLERKEDDNASAAASNKLGADSKTHSKSVLARKPSFVAREKAKIQLKLRIARAIARKRMPLQVRVLTETRKHLSPLEKYFGGPVESVLSDIFWAAIKGDVDRVQFLVQVEGVDSADGTLDPWNLGQTPLHWAAKGGSVAVVEFLLRTGANPRSLDANGSLPLHLSCWAGHVDTTLALLRASSVKDLYLPDYDAGLAPLDWASIRGHGRLIKAIEKYEDTLWLPKFIDDLIRGIVKYKIKLFKDPPKAKAKAVGTTANEPTDAVADAASGAAATAKAVPPETLAAAAAAAAAAKDETVGSKASPTKQKKAKS